MKKLFGKWTLCALAMLGLVSACSDSNDSEGGTTNPDLPPYISEMQKQLAGTWNVDIDGIKDMDLMRLNASFNEDYTMNVELFSYNIDDNKIDSICVPMTYKLAVPDNDKESGKVLLITTPTESGIAAMAAQLLTQGNTGGETSAVSNEDLMEEIITPDSSLVWIDGDSLFMRMAGDAVIDSLYRADESFRAMFTSSMLRGRQSLSMDNITQQREMVEMYKNISDWTERCKGGNLENSFADFGIEQFTNSNSSAPALTRGVHNENFYGHNNRLLRTWMSQVKDDMPVRNMMIPGTHDTATYGMWLPYMWTFARTQEHDISGQWDRGIRCFDLRTRYKDKENRMYHEFMSCYTYMSDVFKDIVEKVKQNPTEGVIVMIKTESNAIGIQNAKTSKNIEYISECIFSGVDFTEPDAVRTMNETGKLVKRYFYDNKLLAEFSPDMTMKDLRGKVLVLLQNAPDANADGMKYPKEILKYIANWKEKRICDMYGNKLTDTKEQNMWEQNKDQDEEEEGYVARKTSQFREVLEWCIANPKSTEWIYNAANGYYWDPWGGLKYIPDYATFAMQAYPTFANDIARLCDVRGIVLMDYVGTDEIKRVSAAALLSVFATLGSAFAILNPIPLPYVNLNFGNLILLYYCCKAASKWKYPHAQELINNMVEVNIPTELNTGISDDPIDYGRAPYRNMEP